MENLSLGGQVMLGMMLGWLIREQRVIKKHLLGCPTCQKSRFPLSPLLAGLLVALASLRA